MRFPPDESSPPEPVALEGSPFSHYYAQDTSDEGIMMETEVPVKQVSAALKNLFYILIRALHNYRDAYKKHSFCFVRESDMLAAHATIKVQSTLRKVRFVK